MFSALLQLQQMRPRAQEPAPALRFLALLDLGQVFQMQRASVSTAVNWENTGLISSASGRKVQLAWFLHGSPS